MNIAGVEIGGSNPCRFVFEVSNAHNGSKDRALRLIDAAKDCGADFVKLQCYLPSELIALRGDGPAPEPWGAQGWTMRTLYEKAATPFVWFPELFQHARDIGIVPFSSVFGAESLTLLESLDCPAYKIARLDRTQNDLVNAVGRTGKPLLVSTDEDMSKGHWPQAEFLYCPPGYPTPNDAVSLPEFAAYYNGDSCTGDCERAPSIYLGLSSHCLDARLPVAAVARGCKMLEMHGMLDDEPSELEANVSLCATDFAAMIDDVRATEALLG